ncbi:MAG: hypothetical protein WD271_16895, partial [Acidimicrobiia bacterium]
RPRCPRTSARQLKDTPLGRRALAVGVVVLCAIASVLVCGGAEAGASRPDRDPRRRPEGRPLHDHADDASEHKEDRSNRPHKAPSPGTAAPVTSPGGGEDGDAPGGEDGALGTESAATGPTPTGPTPIESAPTGPAPTHTVSGVPTVGGGPATTHGAADTEALVAPTAPTPPNGAEPAAAGSPAAVVPPDGPDAEIPAALPPAADVPALPDLLGSAIGATDPQPAANGLSPDTIWSGALVAILAFVVLLFLVAHQLVDRRDPRLRAARDAEAVARFR